MNQLIKFLIVLCVLILHGKEGSSQATGSSNTENSSRYIGGTRSTLAETLYIGPNAHIVVDGTWLIYSKNIVIDPSAIIEGSGTIEIYNPSEVGGIASATYIDGNGSANAIGVNVLLANAEGMEITNLTFPSDLVRDGFSNVASNSSVYIGKDLSLAVDGAHVTLDPLVQGDLVLDQDATISNYRPERMVVTNNSVVSHMVKEDLNGSFIFPVGISKENYTPAAITGSETFHVSVQNYTQSNANEGLLTGGPDRTWHIFADNNVSATIALQHNVATDVAAFVSAEDHYVTQYEGSNWSGGTPEAGLSGTFTTGTSPISGASTQDIVGITLPSSGASFTSYFTKATIQSALPVTLISFKAAVEEEAVRLAWSTIEEQQSAMFEVERSINAQQWKKIGEVPAAKTSNEVLHYELLDSMPAEGVNYYRLKMIDYDQSFTYSDIVSVVSARLPVELSVYPNPATERFYLDKIAATDVKSIRILSVNGQLVQTLSRLPLDGIRIDTLSSGTYIVQVELYNGQSITRKLLIQL
jgi:hypothetical protein